MGNELGMCVLSQFEGFANICIISKCRYIVVLQCIGGMMWFSDGDAGTQ